MSGRSILLWWLVSCLASVSAASAGHPQERHGFWINVAVGVGSAQIHCDDCPSDRETAGVGHVALGGTLNEHLLIGADLNGWQKKQGGVTVNLYNTLATLMIYPQSSGGFFLKAGAGFSFADNDVHDGSTTITVDFGNGLGLVAGAGYDIRLWRNISITPAVSFWYGRHGDVTVGGETIFRNWRHNVADFTIGVTFH
jgi:hypothetical protein